jgi:hypothetical protein
VALISAAASAGAAPPDAHSSDGRWTLRAHAGKRVLLVIAAHDGAIVRSIDVRDRRNAPGRIAGLFDAPPRRSFVVLLADVPEAWELSCDPDAAPVYSGLVHDFRMGEGLAETGPLPVQRLHLDAALTTALFAPHYDFFVASADAGQLHVVSLHVRRSIERLPLPAGAAIEQGIACQVGARPLFVLPDRALPLLHVLDGRDWRWWPPRALPGRAIGLRAAGDGRVLIDLADGRRLQLDFNPHVTPTGG